MKKYDVKITPYALEQMAEIRDYITYQLQNPDAARNLIKNIQSEVMKLSHMPDRFRPIDEEPWGCRGIRKLIIKNFYAYYWIEETSSTVHIIAVTYAMRDQKNVLEEMESPPI